MTVVSKKLLWHTSHPLRRSYLISDFGYHQHKECTQGVNVIYLIEDTDFTLL